MSLCSQVLYKFVADDRQSGLCPLPKNRLSEVRLLLDELKKLELPGEVEVLAGRGGGGAGGKAEISPPESGRSGRLLKVQHLLELYPCLCECITSRQDTFREPLKSLFLLAGKGLGLD